MPAVARLIGPGCLIAGVALLAYALRTGAARVYLVVVIPVFTGSSGIFLLATGLLIVGVLLLPLSFVREAPEREDELPPTAGLPTGPNASSSGGVVLFGPVPLFFGSWRKTPPISYRWAVVVGVVLSVVALLVFWGLAWR